MSESWTLKKILDWCGSYFATKQISSPRLDAELLLAHVLKLTRLDLYLQFDRPLIENELENFKSLVKRRAKHEPIAYLIGKKDFYSREFEVNPHVLIPRPDTETLVEAVLKKLPPAADSKKIQGLDVGTGSGTLAITLAAERIDLNLIACDISAAALSIAKKNAARYGLCERIEFFHADFLDVQSSLAVSNPDSLDFLVSNPPYLTSVEYENLMPDVRDFEPQNALVGGSDGLDFYRVIATRSFELLRPNGLVAVEIGETQKTEVEGIFKNAGLKNIISLKDLSGWDRVVLATT